MGVLLFLGLTLSAFLLFRRTEQQRIRDRFDAEVEILVERVNRRMASHVQILRGAAEFISLRRGEVTRQEWRQYAAALELGRLNPGVQALGYGLWVPAGEVEAHVKRLRAEGFPDYEVHPGGPLPPEGGVSSIVFIEPFDERNQRAFSRDMHAESVRRAAMDRARDTGFVTLQRPL